VELAVEDAGGVVVSACPGGHGVFVTDAALEELAAGPARVAAALDPGAPAAAADTNAPSSCPRCAEPMVRRPAGGDARVIVDTCADHGTWFDAGELRAALAATRTDRSPDAVDPDALSRQSKATLDVALALDEVREGETVRRAVDVTEDVLGMFSLVVLGKSYRPRRRRW
jgi:Zn-finger nucleic acid-binding protein